MASNERDDKAPSLNLPARMLAAITKDGVEAAVADLTDRSSLASAFDGIERYVVGARLKDLIGIDQRNEAALVITYSRIRIIDLIQIYVTIAPLIE